jgi:biopolymer transport protein ExbD
MSHGGGSESKAEPNLTPLLDMVLQLLMFFIVVCNMSMDQVNESVVLPDATQANATDKTETDVLYLNIDPKGRVMVPGKQEPKEGENEIRSYLAGEFRFINDVAKSKGTKGAENTVVIIRAHKDVDFAKVFIVLREAKAAGFKRWQLRALKNQTA